METLILKSGKRTDGSYWVLVQKEEGDFLLSALIATKTAKTVGDKLVIPAAIAKNMQWK